VITERVFYLCPTCFNVSETEDKSHDHAMIRFDAGQPGDERGKPVLDKQGRPNIRAPRWFAENVGWLSYEA
jgi:hypothetical protein